MPNTMPNTNGLACSLVVECLCEMYWAAVASTGHAVPPAYQGLPNSKKNLEYQWDAMHVYLGLTLAAGRLQTAQPSTWATGWPEDGPAAMATTATMATTGTAGPARSTQTTAPSPGGLGLGLEGGGGGCQPTLTTCTTCTTCTTTMPSEASPEVSYISGMEHQQQHQQQNADSLPTGTPPPAPPPAPPSKEEADLQSWLKALKHDEEWQRGKKEEEARAARAARAATTDPSWSSWLEKPKWGCPNTYRTTDWFTMLMFEEARIDSKALNRARNNVMFSVHRPVRDSIYEYTRRAVGEWA